MRYDAEVPPEAAVWLSMDEGDRIALVLDYHKRIRQHAPNLRLHAAIHVAIENQLAESIPEVVATLTRLQQEGLARHDAIHALGSVLAKYIYQIEKGQVEGQERQAGYIRDIQTLTAASWRAGAS